jgi:hypothetical protein
MQYAVIAVFLLAIVAGSFAAVILGDGYPTPATDQENI